MDGEFRDPEDVARAEPERVTKVLVSQLRRGFELRPFVMRLRFQFNGGRSGPLLYLGNLNRAWSDYINNNVRAMDMATGVCSLGRGETGRTIIRLEVRSGRGGSASNIQQLNRSLRYINAQAELVESAETAAATGGVPAAGANPAPQQTSAQETLDLRKAVQVIRDHFEQFKAEPTAERLTVLLTMIAEWRTGLAQFPQMVGSQEKRFIAKMAVLLEAKGKAFVAERSA